MKDLGVLPGGTTSSAAAINAAGQVAGVSSVATGANHAFRWSAETGMVDLGVSPGCYSLSASGMNSNGDIVGLCIRDPVTTVYRPFVWTQTRGLEDLGTYFGDKEGGASAINDRGQIVGFSAPESYYDDSRAVLWTRVGNATQLGTCGADLCSGEGVAINSNGDVAGTMAGRGVVWRQGRTATQLVDLGGAQYSRPTGINDRGQIVGVIYPPAGETLIKAFSWTEPEGLFFIQPVTGKAEVFVSGINNKGEIVGYSR
jgi:probable HAF family extracellular repeat protein